MMDEISIELDLLNQRAGEIGWAKCDSGTLAPVNRIVPGWIRASHGASEFEDVRIAREFTGGMNWIPVIGRTALPIVERYTIHHPDDIPSPAVAGGESAFLARQNTNIR